MGRVIWDNVKAAKKQGHRTVTYGAEIKPTINSFAPPSRFQDDYRKVLMTDHPHTNFWFKRLVDWYRDKDKTGDDIIWIRAEQTPIQWKSAIGNADLKTNFNTDWDQPIQRGDIMIREDGRIYMLDWAVQEDIINQNSQSIECNTYFEIQRHMGAVTNDEGDVIVPAHNEIIIPKIPGVCSEYTGRPDFEVLQSTVGITSGDLLTCYVQWNSVTQQMRIGDEFEFGFYMYRIENISVERVDITKTFGEIMFHGRRVTGGDLRDY